MDQNTLEKLLADLPLGSLRYFPTIGSTNDLAARWAEAGAADLSLVVADEQTAGRGRMQRRWLTPAGSALAFTLVLRQDKEELLSHLAQVTALGALAVCDTLNAALPPVTPAQVKWPNDVLASRRKLAGVLAEAHWRGDQLVALILGIGINVAPDSVPSAELLDFPATCVETELETSVERWELLHAVLKNLLEWRKHLNAEGFMQAWERRLAFRGEWVSLLAEGQAPLEGQVLGLNADGSLRLRLRSGEVRGFQFGEIRLRPPAQAI
jgi:BirA family transcriptional regulator, biotin operon repressor / biotin---[acetyl-CoA-carboxylase] ligase